MRKRIPRFGTATLPGIVLIATLVCVPVASAQTDLAVFPGNLFIPDNLVVSRSVYVNTNAVTAGTTLLPPNCSAVNCPTLTTAVTGSAYPYVFNNDSVDPSFGITSWGGSTTVALYPRLKP